MAVKQMGSAPNENAYVCVRSGSLFFWLPMDQLLYITSSHMLRDAVVERKDPRDAPVALLDGRRIGVFSLRGLLGRPGADEERHALILQTNGALCGLLVDEVTDTISAGAYTILPLPDAVKSPENTFLQGLIWMENRGAPAFLTEPELLLSISGQEAGQAI